MSTTNSINDKSAANSGRPTVGVEKNKVHFTSGFKVLSVPPGYHKPIVPTKKKMSTAKYPDSPTRNAKKVKKSKDIDIKVARDLKFEFQGIFPDTYTDVRAAMKKFSLVDVETLNRTLSAMSEMDIATLNKAIHSVGNSAESVETLIGNLKSSSESIKSHMIDAGFSLKEFSFFTSTLLSVVFLIQSFNDKKFRTYFGVAFIIAIASAPSTTVSKFTSAVAPFFGNTVEPQVFAFPIDAISNILSIALGAATVGTCQKHYFQKFNEVLSTYDRKTSSISTILKMLTNGITSAINFGLEKLGHGKLYHFNDTGNLVANQFITDYNELVRLIDEKKFSPNDENFKTLISLCNRAQDILIEARKNRESDNLLKVIATIHSKLLAKKELFLASNYNLSGVRTEPVCVVLRGKPGVGKSQTVLFLHAAICAFALKGDEHAEAKQDPTKFMYNRQPENVYWDGYDIKHITTVFDDLGQIRDVAGNPDCEYMNLIRAVNEFPAMLHTAAMEKKANTFFRSEFVIVTTNASTFHPESITSAEALHRRFNLCYEVSVKEEFATDGMIDGDKLPYHPSGEVQCDPSILTFHAYDYATQRHVGNPIGFMELVTKVRERWMENRRRNSIKIFNLSALMDQVDQNFAAQSGIQMSSIYEFEDSDDDFGEAQWFDAPDVVFDAIFNPLFLSYSAKIAEALRIREDCVSLLLVQSIMGQFDLDWKRTFVANPLRFVAFLDRHYDKLGLQRLDCYTEIKDTVCGKIARWMKNHYPQVLTVVSSVIASLTIYHVIASRKDEREFHDHGGFSDDMFENVYHGSNLDEDASVGSSVPQYAMKKPKDSRPKKDFRALKKELEAQPQSYAMADLNGAKIVDKVMARNVYRISMFCGRTVEQAGFGVFLRGTSMLIPQHFVEQAAAFMQIDSTFAEHDVHFDLATLGKTDLAQRFTITLREFVMFSEIDQFKWRDLAVLKLPKHIPMHQDIVAYFLSNSDFDRIKDWNVRLILAHEEKYESISSAAKAIVVPINVQGDDYIESKTLKRGLVYQGHTTKGDCGGLLVNVNSRLPKARLLGIHVAGMPGRNIGIASTVSREELEEFFDRFPADFETFEPDEFDQTMLPEAQSRFKGLYTAKLKHNAGIKTNIERSDMYGYDGDVFTAPSVLRPVYRVIDGQRVLVDPYHKALTKYCSPTISFDHLNVGMAMNCVYEHIRRNSTEFDSLIVSFERAVIGDPDDEFFNSVSRATSAGYPYSSQNLGRGKFYFFGSGDAFDLAKPECQVLRKSVEDILDCARNGIRLEHIFTDNLKDERRPLAKIESVSTRLFSGAPLAYTIAFRMMFGKFMSWYIRNNIENGSAIGLNVYDIGWDILASKLCAFSNPEDEGFGAGDYSAFDGSEKPNIHWAILDMINKFYGDSEENKRIRRILWYELVNSKHIRGDQVYCWPSSLPSGHPCTTIVNNLYNHIAFNMCWIQLGLPVFGEGSFYDNVYLVTMGDDNIYSVSVPFREKFNEFAVSEEMAKLGLIYTPEVDKSAKVKVGLRKLTEVSFLKRSFRFDSFTSRWVAPIDMSVILDMPNWTKNNPELRHSITKDNVESALMELSLHGEEVFDKYSTRIISGYKSTNLPPLKYETYLANVGAIHNRLRFL